MLKWFLKDQLLILILIPILAFAYIFINENVNYFEIKPIINLGFWGTYSIKLFNNYFIYINVLIITFNSYLLNFIFNSNSFYEKNSYVVALLYLVLLSFYHSFYIFDGLLLAQTFIILGLYQLLKLDYNEDGRKKVFNIGIFIGLAGTIFTPILFYLPLIFIMITRIRPFIFRELFLTLIGSIIPLIYVISFNFIFDNKINLFLIQASESYSQKEIIFLSSLILFSLLLIMSLIGINTKAQKSSIRFRKNITILFLFLISGIGLGIINWIFFQQYEWFCFIVFPISLFLPFSYLNNRFKMVSTILFYITFSISVIKFFI
jgi:hypothetical protein